MFIINQGGGWGNRLIYQLQLTFARKRLKIILNMNISLVWFHIFILCFYKMSLARLEVCSFTRENLIRELLLFQVVQERTMSVLSIYNVSHPHFNNNPCLITRMKNFSYMLWIPVMWSWNQNNSGNIIFLFQCMRTTE